MAPTQVRQLLVWTLPTIAVLLSYLWYKKKRIGAPSDPGDKKPQTQREEIKNPNASRQLQTPKKGPETQEEDLCTPQTSPKSFSRSLSGIESTPIDIVIPRELRSVKSNPIVISDEDLDLEIEKIKSMKTGSNLNSSRSTACNSPAKISPIKTKTPSPEKEAEADILSMARPTPKTSKNKENKISPTTTINDASFDKKDISEVEKKLSSFKIESVAKETARKETPRTPAKKQRAHNSSSDREELQRQSSERDSANHSPVDTMLASPSLSSISDNHSEGSNDSGKGASDVATPPPSRTPGADITNIIGDVDQRTVFHFVIAQNLVGKLIGKRGAFVSQVKDKTNTHILVKKHPSNNKLKLCAIEGNKKDIEKALKMIRERFPLKKFPDVTLEEVPLYPEVPTISLIPDHLYLKLVEGINNDTIMSCMVTPSHLFLQQPTHPTFPNLNVLTNYMNACYSEVDSPMLPTPIPENTICAAFSVDSWYRAMILSTDADTESSYVKFLDYGGYAYVKNSSLRQIRGDFMLLPFQAAECFLANVKPKGGDELQWHEEAYSLVADLTKGAIIYTQVAEYTDDGMPLVHCYVVVGPQQIVFLNQELVNRGFAEWVTYDEETEGAVGGVVA